MAAVEMFMYRHYLGTKMTQETANQVYDILVARCGALENGRESFVFHMTRGCREYRCCWKFGSGGKLYVDIDKLRVDGYPEDMTPELEKLRDDINDELYLLGSK